MLSDAIWRFIDFHSITDGNICTSDQARQRERNMLLLPWKNGKCISFQYWHLNGVHHPVYTRWQYEYVSLLLLHGRTILSLILSINFESNISDITISQMRRVNNICGQTCSPVNEGTCYWNQLFMIIEILMVWKQEVLEANLRFFRF